MTRGERSGYANKRHGVWDLSNVPERGEEKGMLPTNRHTTSPSDVQRVTQRLGGQGFTVPSVRCGVYGAAIRWILSVPLVLAIPGVILLMSVLAAPAQAMPSARGVDIPAIDIFVNVDELAVLWGFRDPKTGTHPKKGDADYPEYLKRWQVLIKEVFKEIRQRVPHSVKLLPATPDAPHTGLHIDMTVADISTSCHSEQYYKYLWVRTYQDDGLSTNWDGLGVRSDTVVKRTMDDPARVKADVDTWVQLWAQLPYLHLVRPSATKTPTTNAPPASADSGAVNR